MKARYGTMHENRHKNVESYSPNNLIIIGGIPQRDRGKRHSRPIYVRGLIHKRVTIISNCDKL